MKRVTCTTPARRVVKCARLGRATTPLTFVFAGDYAGSMIAPRGDSCAGRIEFFQSAARVPGAIRLAWRGKGHHSVSGDSCGVRR